MTQRFRFLVFVFLALAACAYAQSPREQFQSAVAAYQQNATEANVEKLAGLYKQITPPPAVPEQAEFHAQKGGAFVRLAKTPADYERAAKEFQTAINLAPWISEYHYNLAICYKSAQQFNPALASLKFAQILARDDKERRETLGLRAEIEAVQEIAARQTKDAEQQAVAAEKERLRLSVEGRWTGMIFKFQVTKSGEKFDLIPLGFNAGITGQWQATGIELDRNRVKFNFLNPSLKCPECNISHIDLSLSESGSELKGTATLSGKTYPHTFKRMP